jgi:hypothetical protein
MELGGWKHSLVDHTCVDRAFPHVAVDLFPLVWARHVVALDAVTTHDDLRVLDTRYCANDVVHPFPRLPHVSTDGALLAVVPRRKVIPVKDRVWSTNESTRSWEPRQSFVSSLIGTGYALDERSDLDQVWIQIAEVRVVRRDDLRDVVVVQAMPVSLSVTGFGRIRSRDFVDDQVVLRETLVKFRRSLEP